MKKYLTLIASFFIMLCTGSVYAWSIVAAELVKNHGFQAAQSQVIFGTLIGVFPVTMIFVGQLSKTIKHRYFGYFAGVLFLLGYLLAGLSQGSFLLILLGIGVLAGVATGSGYWVALTAPVQWFPHKKGLITGIAAAGFGLGAVFMSTIAESLLLNGYSVLQLLQIIGIAYGVLILIASNLIHQADSVATAGNQHAKRSQFIHTKIFRKLLLGIFLGTFAGLLIIGSLKIIGARYNISEHNLILGVSLFAVANFLGRLIWGYFSDHLGAGISIFMALLCQSVGILSLNLFALTTLPYFLFILLIGFGFGGNFVLFAKETAQVFGVANLGIIYPYVFTGYALAGIAGPFSGGALFDLTGSYTSAIYLAGFISLAGGLLFLNQFFKEKREAHIS